MLLIAINIAYLAGKADVQMNCLRSAYYGAQTSLQLNNRGILH